MSDHTNPNRLRSGARLTAALAGFALLIAACGGDADVVDAQDGTTSSAADATTTSSGSNDSSERTIVTTDADDDSTDGTEPAAETTTTEVAVTTTEAVADTGIAGEPLDFGPSEGTPLAIVGVAYNDTLNFRVDPSPDADIVVSHGPLLDDLDTSALGSAWAAPSGVWWMVDVGGTDAWANQAFLGSLGTTINAFDQISADLDVFEYDTVEAAALAVAELRASDDPVSSIVFASEPLAFETGGFAIVDVIGLGDDSVKGERIRVEVRTVFDADSGEEGAQDVDYFLIVDVEITAICGRGLSGGLCT